MKPFYEFKKEINQLTQMQTTQGKIRAMNFLFKMFLHETIHTKRLLKVKTVRIRGRCPLFVDRRTKSSIPGRPATLKNSTTTQPA